jgi:hypothetical protein
MDSFVKSIIKQKDDAIFAEIQHSFGVDLDRAELIRALQYDRGQYDKGYADGKRDAMDSLVHCKDCKHWDAETCFCDELSQFYNHGFDWYMFDADDFCSCGERREGE